MKKKLVVLTGAGISAESGIMTFRDAGGLWENHSIEEVATPEGWHKNTNLVLQFYNERRAKSAEAIPNVGHLALVALEKHFDVRIITQNVDGLHEKAGSTDILHLHGELSKVRSVTNENLIYEIGTKNIEIGDLAEDGGQLRPHIVWFGELVPMFELAAELCSKADLFVVIGTSMQVYPAASLIGYVSDDSPKYIIDPNMPEVSNLYQNVTFINEKASVGVPQLAEKLINEFVY
jgi:NAD-dependent deacetylase